MNTYNIGQFAIWLEEHACDMEFYFSGMDDTSLHAYVLEYALCEVDTEIAWSDSYSFAQQFFELSNDEAALMFERAETYDHLVGYDVSIEDVVRKLWSVYNGGKL